MEKLNSQLEHGQPNGANKSVAQVLLTVNHDTSITFGN